MLYPDAQIEYTDAEGRTGRVNIEAVSGNYREPAVKAKAAAGFALHANGPAAAALLGRLGLGSDGGSWLRDPPTAIPPQSNSDHGRTQGCSPGKSARDSPPPSPDRRS